MHFAVSRREVAESRRWSTIPIEFTNALRRFSPRIDEFLMEVAVARVMVVRSAIKLPSHFLRLVSRLPDSLSLRIFRLAGFRVITQKHLIATRFRLAVFKFLRMKETKTLDARRVGKL